MRTRFQREQSARLAVLIALLKSLTARWILVTVALSIPLSAMAGEDASARTRRFVLNPGNDIYPRYVADPRRSRHIVSVIQTIDSELPDSGNTRFMLSIGGQYPLVRMYSPDVPERAWQLDVEARFFSQFDIDYNLDEIGHDGRVGLIVSKGISDSVALRGVFHHTSSHIGDEYMLRNHITERFSARKEELAVGASWKPRPHWRTYGETGFGINLGPSNEPLRVQCGLEYESEPIFKSARWYAATDVTTFQEDDWKPSGTFQTGIVLPVEGRARWYRVGVEFYDGRSQLDSFFLYRERYVVFGAWLDL